MQRNTSTSIIYILTAVACSVFMLSRDLEAGGRWSVLFLVWLIVGAVPLLFVFAYPRFLFADPETHKRIKFAALLHAAAGVTATVLFIVLSPFWKSPVRHIDDSIPHLLVPPAVLVVFFVAAIFLLLKNKSTLAMFASFLFWPYWLLLALTFVNRWFQDTGIHAAYYFLCFVTPILFAFAAGAISYRPTIAHAAAFTGIVGAPWLYSDLIKRFWIRQCLAHVQSAG
jgi:FtsH-binding integral membrane protein